MLKLWTSCASCSRGGKNEAHLQAEEGRRDVDGGARMDRQGGPVDADLRQRLLAAAGGQHGGAEGDQQMHQRRHDRRSRRRLHP